MSVPLPSLGFVLTLRRLVLLRWWLLAGLAAAVAAAPTLLDISVPVWPLLAVLLLWAVFNFLAARRDAATPGELAGQIGVDLFAMAVVCYLTGGVANPLVSLLLLPVAVAALALPLVWAAAIAALAIALYTFLLFYSLPLPVADAARAARLHLSGMWLTFVVSAVMIAWFVARMTASIRARDAQLAAAREQALRDAQVLSLGQLAAGAAHELGTPLATMHVLVGELLDEPSLSPSIREDLQLLRQQIAACKEIIGGLTRRAGIARAEGDAAIPVLAWLEALLARWRSLWPQASCRLEVEPQAAEQRLRPDPAFEQAVINLLNNAARVSPLGLAVRVTLAGDRLCIAILDAGPGFPPEVLKSGGAQPLPSQGEGAGIGLWLSRAAIERLGGRLVLENTPAGGQARLELPLDNPEER
ncbi:MAG: ATP-binding protein [Rhodocyclaceae bacterium]|nr:ATP-binding protein [Rhodocyclaceae bacterium]